MGRLTKDPELRYSQSAEPSAIVRYTLAVNRIFKREGEPGADFINCVAFGKMGEFAANYFKKGQMVAITGRLQIKSWEKDGQRQWMTEVVIEDQYFTGSKADNKPAEAPTSSGQDEFFAADESIEEEDLPF